jgi:hypothetical protein
MRGKIIPALFLFIALAAFSFYGTKTYAACGCSCAVICEGRCSGNCENCDTVIEAMALGATCCAEAQHEAREQGWLTECPVN